LVTGYFVLLLLILVIYILVTMSEAISSSSTMISSPIVETFVSQGNVGD